MCYAYRAGNGDFIQHKVRDVFAIKFSQSGNIMTSDTDLYDLRRNTYYENHGWWMWTVWMPIGFLLLATKRYFKKQWSCMHVIHVLLGYFCMLTTLIWTLKMLNYFDWQINCDLHSLAGFFSCCITMIVGLSGSFTAALMQFKRRQEWIPRESVTNAAKFHRYSGYVMLLIGNATAMSGIQHYYGEVVMDYDMAPLGLISLLIFIVLVFIFEFFYRLANHRSDMVIVTPDNHGAANRRFMVYTSE